MSLFGCNLILFGFFFQIILCDIDCVKEHHDSKSKGSGLITSFIKFLDEAIEFIFETLLGFQSISDNEQKSSSIVSYEGFQFLRIWPKTNDDVDDIINLSDQSQVQIWSPVAKNMSTDIVLPPNIAFSIKEQLNERNVEYATISSDIEQIIKHQSSELRDGVKQRFRGNKNNKFTGTLYPSFEDIMDYTSYIQTTFPNLVDLINIGKSSEGTEIKLIKISTGRLSNGSPKPALWIDGGMHAREWISIAVALYIVKQLTENHKTYQNLLTDMDWYILPVANPDGYIYSYTTDRLWKKSRSPNNKYSNRYFWRDDDCKGVDLSRNWDFQWPEDSILTSDNDFNPCHENYIGPTPFSEPETRAISNFIMEHRNEIIIYLTLHSYSQSWLMPVTATKAKSTDYDDLVYVARKAIESIRKTHGTQYELVTKLLNIHPNTGNADDWVKNKAGVKYVYTVELRDKGSYGFLLPANEIISTGKEIFTGIRTLAKSVLSNAINKNSKY